MTGRNEPWGQHLSLQQQIVAAATLPLPATVPLARHAAKPPPQGLRVPPGHGRRRPGVAGADPGRRPRSRPAAARWSTCPRGPRA